ncbi:MAG TPA: fumarylacetoacetate hydrolase [Elusimicrobia bacterium]|nr:MAG: fumarylacetoacetate hydrolase [Elusimicrobia bacterium GWA2_64_40]HAN05634.1 fumarylacetoacetate hydrolase [Elusimicrobiota bacterium]HAU90495.1 fumarylacetoacetate hydrolase [Elusimicrobiota bacterium]HCS48447.1 fumarylacetoacetate hydrolase [Candidatus Aminicenantes bacterium]
MRFIRFALKGREGLAVLDGSAAHGFFGDEPGYPGGLSALIREGAQGLTRAAAQLRKGAAVNLDIIDYLPPVDHPGKILCLGVNYRAHGQEAGIAAPPRPTVFVRFPSSLVGHSAALVRPKVSVQFDYEGELAVVVGKGGRHIPVEKALEHVAGYTILNDGSIRDYQLETPQWTIGKNFDSSGAMGPFFVTADELPPGGAGLRLETRLNGEVQQNASTADMVHDVAHTIAFLSQAMTLSPGDVIATGTPPGVGMARKPPLYMKAGDVCEVAVEGLGVLRNTVNDEA